MINNQNLKQFPYIEKEGVLAILAGNAVLCTYNKFTEDDLILFLQHPEQAEEKLDWYTYNAISYAVECVYIVKDLVDCNDEITIEIIDALAWTSDKFTLYNPITNPNPELIIDKTKVDEFIKDLKTVNTLPVAQKIWDKWQNKPITNFGHKKMLYFLIQFQLWKNHQWSFDPRHEMTTNFCDDYYALYEEENKKYRWW